MAKFRGVIGYGETVTDTETGISELDITEHPCTGDVIRNAQNLSFQDSVNGEITAANSISVVADERARNNRSKIKYVKWGGVRWTVSSVEVRHPRLVLILGEVYNGPTP